MISAPSWISGASGAASGSIWSTSRWRIGDYVLNHVGFAIRRIPPEDVQTTLALYEELLRESQKADGGDLMVADVLGEIAAGAEGTGRRAKG